MKKRHFIFLDDLSKLTVKKDSTLLLAKTLQDKGVECYLVFEKDLYFDSKSAPCLKCSTFSSTFYEQGPYLKTFVLGESLEIQLNADDIIHMRLDPPFDSRYLRYLWILSAVEHFGIQVVNRPRGILIHHEKISAYLHDSSAASYIGESVEGLLNFSRDFEGGHFILKPLDLFQGMGIDKANHDSLVDVFIRKREEFKGPVIVQPFLDSIFDGEVRSLYFKGHEIGSILKTPPKGEFLANIAQGASFRPYELSSEERRMCEEVTSELLKDGVDWVAFDILGGHLSEVNLTCPGLLVEVSYAYKENLAEKIVDMLPT